MTAYYNEIDPKAAAWLRELIKQGHIADGVVDERSIIDVTPDELRGFTQCHFFAGIGVWSYALQSAGWADDRPVWTGSCPCQPFSTAGRQGGFDDERHLWPHWHHLISQCQPAIVFGEQVASKDGLGWLDLVSTDMEATGYAFGAADLCAAGIGAPHIRQRLFFGAVRLADADDCGHRLSSPAHGDCEGHAREAVSSDGGCHERLAHALRLGQQGSRQVGRPYDPAPQGNREEHRTVDVGGRGRLANSDSHGRSARDRIRSDGQEHDAEHGGGTNNDRRPSPTNGHWGDADWLYCRDGKWRAVEPSTFPLVNGAAERVGRLRGYGNAIVAQVAQTFIESMMEITA
jgi:DNA (cytosine-5)-methyltransferase 1